jgi:hypothetical protein
MSDAHVFRRSYHPRPPHATRRWSTGHLGLGHFHTKSSASAAGGSPRSCGEPALRMVPRPAGGTPAASAGGVKRLTAALKQQNGAGPARPGTPA